MHFGRTAVVAIALTAVTALTGATSARAVAQYDPPSLTFHRAGFFRIDLDVQAGASGAPGGFVIEWIAKADYDRLGGWPANGNDGSLNIAVLTGEPTLNIDSHSASFTLPPEGITSVQLGDMFDETGLEATYGDGLLPGTEYVIRTYALGDDNGFQSDFSADLFAATTTAPECTQGFWKTHEDQWPAGCVPMTLGTVSYTQAELLAIFNTPANGNGLISLAHQLISIKLNICNGSDPTAVLGDIASADALIGSLVVPPVGSGFLAPGSTATLTQTLDDYNNGLIPGVVSCPTPTRKASWGALKVLYR